MYPLQHVPMFIHTTEYNIILLYKYRDKYQHRNRDVDFTDKKIRIQFKQNI